VVLRSEVNWIASPAPRKPDASVAAAARTARSARWAVRPRLASAATSLPRENGTGRPIRRFVGLVQAAVDA